MQTSLSDQRSFVTPEPGEDWKEVAARVLPDTPTDAAVRTLKSWNLHLMARMPPGEFTGSDVLFVEPPRVEDASMLGNVDMSDASTPSDG